jgi:hypothetical protein
VRSGAERSGEERGGRRRRRGARAASYGVIDQPIGRIRAAGDPGHLTSLAQRAPTETVAASLDNLAELDIDQNLAISAHQSETSGENWAPLTNLLWNLRAREKRAAGRLRRHLPHRPRQKHQTRRLATNRPCLRFVYEEPHPKERLRVSNWIVQRPYNFAVKETVKL